MKLVSIHTPILIPVSYTHLDVYKRQLLFGAPQLRGKESDRIATTSALLTVLGRRHTPRSDGIEIFGAPLSEQERARPVRFDATGDHRLVMAAAVARWAGFPIAIQGLSAVNKSFPEFLEIARLGTKATPARRCVVRRRS